MSLCMRFTCPLAYSLIVIPPDFSATSQTDHYLNTAVLHVVYIIVQLENEPVRQGGCGVLAIQHTASSSSSGCLGEEVWGRKNNNMI